MSPATPSPLLQSASAPTTRLQKRSSTGRPPSSSRRLENGRRVTSSTPDMRTQGSPGWRQEAQDLSSRPSSNQAHSTFELRDSGTVKSSWFRRMSTLSSSRQDSPVSSPRPGSPSVSYSNGSSAPMLPNPTYTSTMISNRNRLVKRTSSQRALGSNSLHSTLRRPATSYQRSASLRQHYQQDEAPSGPATSRPSLYFSELQEDQSSSNDSIQSWRCFFRSKSTKVGKDGFSRKRLATPHGSRSESLKTVMSDAREPPTLLLGTSVTPPVGDDTVLDSTPDVLDIDCFPAVGLSTERPSTGLETGSSPWPRSSFSISEMFPSTSPSTWKMPRSSSLRRAKASQAIRGGRRIASAPQSTKPSHMPGISSERATARSRDRIDPAVFHEKDRPLASPGSLNSYARVASSPLPPLNRLSTFEIELPGAAPSYPTTPLSDATFPSPRLSSPPSPLLPSPLGPHHKRKLYRPSAVPSDHGSTLLGSDNDNSRVLSGDEDDFDNRSETVYDSTRTGATGNSHSGVRKMPVQTIFNEPSPTEIQKQYIAGHPGILSNDAVPAIGTERDCITEEDESVSTPVRPTTSSKEGDFPTPVRVSPLPHTLSSVINPDHKYTHGMSNETEDEFWSLDAPEDSIQNDLGSTHQGSPLQVQYRPPTNDYYLSPELDETNTPSKFNIFDWSEQPSMERDSTQASSARPKTMHGKQDKGTRGTRANSRRGPNALHLRSQSVPAAPDSSGHRANPAKLESWVLGNKGVSEDWDGDFDFDESMAGNKPELTSDEPIRTSLSSSMLIPRSIIDRQASVHGQFGHVKELTLLVEELKRLRQQAMTYGILSGQSVELWKEAEGIINLATLDDEEQEFRPPRSPNSPAFEPDPFEEDSPSISSRRKSSAIPSPKENESYDQIPGVPSPSSATPERSRRGTPPSSRPRKESAAKAKSVLENIHQQRTRNSPSLVSERQSQKKLPFDTTSLRDLVIRAGVVTRALKEIVRRVENSPEVPERGSSTPPDPPFSQIFQQSRPSPSPALNKPPRVSQSPKNSSFRSGTITGNDNDINGHMKMMTVV
ncbi:MAG: hypothetical protein LQ342_001677 [Letrouitia transgressa]|nr:MAG: hypothetical protein LQ342_001677 [Letrouitia transgressa]